MAKHTGRGRGRRSPLVVLKVFQKSTLGTLADNTVTTQTLIPSFTNKFFVISTDLTYAVLNLTAGEGPLSVGIVHGGYTVAQILEGLDASQEGPDDLIAIEQGRRKIRDAGTFSGNETEETLNDGQPIRTKVRFSVGIASDLDAFLVNRSGGPLTTGASWTVTGKIYGKWV